MKFRYQTLAMLFIAISLLFAACDSKKQSRSLSIDEYRSKMKAGWLGQMAGVGWGAPTEFKFNGVIIPEENVPAWKPEMINQQYQDDIYVEMTFLKTLEDHGFDVDIRQAGIDFANSQYMLWHANFYGRENLRSGIAPPYSGHPQFNSHADDIDYQIEADYSGLIAPGMPQTVIDLGEKFGRLMNYGDGVYGGQFVGAMYAEAFFETEIPKIIDAGLACIPSESQYAEAINDVIRWHRENPKDWQKTWQLIDTKYNLNPEYRKFSCNGTDHSFNIDAKINGAFIVMGLLYGEGDMDKTITISMRCGMDSDCNPSNAAGILATSLGMEHLPAKYKTNIDETTRFSYTAYDFPALLEVCEKLCREAILLEGGKIIPANDGSETFLIPIKKPVIGSLQQSWDAGKANGDPYFTDGEMEQIKFRVRNAEDFVNSWQVAGPFSQTGADDLALFDIPFNPENDNNYTGWVDLPETPGAKIIDLRSLYDKNNCVAYLRTNAWIDSAQTVIFEIGSDDGVKLWLNSNLIHENNVNRGHMQGDDKVTAKLDQGWNSIMMKITQGTGGWETSLVITDKEHKVPKKLRIKRN